MKTTKTHIYHMRPSGKYTFPTYGTQEEKKTWIKKNRVTGYTKVAELTLNSNNLDVAYTATQNGLDEQYPSWVALACAYEENETFVSVNTRSTMVGDIIRQNDRDYLVDNAGFLEV